jgi:hypothetical protein
MNIPVLTSRIDSVTVYRQGALVCRTAIVLAAQPVPPQIKLVNLPLSLDDGSVRVRVEGEGGELPVASDVRIALDLAVSTHEAAAARRRRAQEGPPGGRGDRRVPRPPAGAAAPLREAAAVRAPGQQARRAPLDSPVKARLTMLEFRHKAIAQLDDASPRRWARSGAPSQVRRTSSTATRPPRRPARPSRTSCARPRSSPCAARRPDRAGPRRSSSTWSPGPAGRLRTRSPSPRT